MGVSVFTKATTKETHQETTKVYVGKSTEGITPSIIKNGNVSIFSEFLFNRAIIKVSSGVRYLLEGSLNNTPTKKHLLVSQSFPISQQLIKGCLPHQVSLR